MWDTIAVVVILLLAAGFIIYRYCIRRSGNCGGCGECGGGKECPGRSDHERS